MTTDPQRNNRSRKLARAAHVGVFGAREPAGGKYQIVRRLGRGGMGTVYLGLDTGLDGHVAIKVLHAPLLEEEVFAREIHKSAARMDGSSR